MPARADPRKKAVLHGGHYSLRNPRTPPHTHTLTAVVHVNAHKHAPRHTYTFRPAHTNIHTDIQGHTGTYRHAFTLTDLHTNICIDAHGHENTQAHMVHTDTDAERQAHADTRRLLLSWPSDLPPWLAAPMVGGPSSKRGLGGECIVGNENKHALAEKE